tara:strand:+ start:724 stop:867 length:144 start_codon:yes stop_codon:yes gene_type:complete
MSDRDDSTGNDKSQVGIGIAGLGAIMKRVKPMKKSGKGGRSYPRKHR